MEQLSKKMSVETNTRKKRGAVFSVRSVSRSYKKEKEGRLSQLSFETPDYQDISLEMEEFLSELIESAVEDD
jgi:hypothetical protein